MQGEGYVVKATTDCRDERGGLRAVRRGGQREAGAPAAHGGPGELGEVLRH